MLPNKINFIPLHVALWLQEIRRNAEEYDEILKERSTEENSSSSDSIYDNVNIQDLRDNCNEAEDVEKCSRPSESGAADKCLREAKTFSCPTWPLRKYPLTADRQSLKNLLEYILWKDDVKMWFRLKDESRRLIHFNWLNSKLTMIKRVLNLSDIIYGRRFSEFTIEEGGKPSALALMSNLLGSYREKHTQECIWTLLNGNDGLLSLLIRLLHLRSQSWFFRVAQVQRVYVINALGIKTRFRDKI